MAVRSCILIEIKAIFTRFNPSPSTCCRDVLEIRVRKDSFSKIESISGKKMNFVYSDIHREGDHICYYSNLEKMKEHFPNWGITKDLNDIFLEIFNKHYSNITDLELPTPAQNAYWHLKLTCVPEIKSRQKSEQIVCFRFRL